MKILILETSSEKGAIVLAENTTPVAVRYLAGGPLLSKTLAAEVASLNPQDIDLVAVGTGPGSYTGIRVGAALAQGLAYGWNVPLLGYCSLKAFGSPPVLVDARMGGIYALLEDTPLLLAPDDPRLQTIPFFSSPHPEQIKKRLVKEGKEVGPDPKRMAQLVYTQFLEEGAGPLILHYLSSP